MMQSTVLEGKTAEFDLDILNQQFEHAHPKTILAWCNINIPTGLVQVSNFNIDDVVITDILYSQLKSKTKIPILFLDTLHHFPETLELVTKATRIYSLDLQVYKIPRFNSRTTFAQKYGKALWEKDGDLFQKLTKIEPLHRGLTDLKSFAWISGRCRNQATISAHLKIPVFERDEHQRLKINPLANWTRVESWAYVYEYDLVYNPLYDLGYTTIGDEPLTHKF